MLNIAILRWYRNISIAKKLFFAVGIMALLIAVELFTLWFATDTLSALRAYIEGEGLWSKGQKDAVFHLQKYAHTRNEKDYADFKEFMKVPLGDHQAREEMIKPNPDLEIVRAGFRQGRNHASDIDGMIYLFRRFHNISYIEKAISIWTEADPLILQLLPLAEKLHDEVNAPAPDNEKIAALLVQVEATNEKLTVLEDEFSFTLGEASRWLENVILKLLIAVALTVELTGLLLTISVSRNIQKGIAEIIRAAGSIGKGNLGERAVAYSKDEIGVLANSFNQMADELSRSIAERQRADEKFRTLMESTPDAIVIVNNNGVIEVVNKQTEKVFGASRGEITGRHVAMLFPDYLIQPAGGNATFAKTAELLTLPGQEIKGVRKDGTSFPVEISFNPLETEEGTWISLSIRDVTEKKHANEALQNYAHKLEVSNRSLEQFAYVASHDLQEPLRTITNFARLLEERQKSNLDDTAARYLHHVVSGANRMKDLVRDMLVFSRLGRLHVVEDVNCHEVVKNVVADMDFLIKENGAAINVQSLPVLKWSKTEVQQLFYNLINNAIKYRRKNIAPVVEIASTRLNGSGWLFTVKDNGIGIEREYSEKIFTIFQRLHNQNEYSGTGIGLAICKKIVEMNGGQIWVESEPQNGSTFYFTFPAN